MPTAPHEVLRIVTCQLIANVLFWMIARQTNANTKHIRLAAPPLAIGKVVSHVSFCDGKTQSIQTRRTIYTSTDLCQILLDKVNLTLIVYHSPTPLNNIFLRSVRHELLHMVASVHHLPIIEKPAHLPAKSLCGYAFPDSLLKHLRYSQLNFYEYNNYECMYAWDGDKEAYNTIVDLWGEDVAKTIVRL